MNVAMSATYATRQEPRLLTPDGFRLVPGPSAYQMYDTPQPFEVRDARTGATFLQFEADYSAPGGPGEVVAGYRTADRKMNFFAIDILTGQAKFLITGGQQRVVVNERWVAMTEGICYAQHSLLLMDRRTSHMAQSSTSMEATAARSST